jgi:ADP-ribosylglycohydrolase
MTFETLPLTARTLKATESRLKAIYDAAALGLSGDSLALASGMMPSEYRRLCDLDPLAALAAQKGKADAEAEMAGVVKGAALAGDAKMALEFLKHRADWVAKQQVQVDVRQQISVLAALEQAQGRVIEGQAQDVLPSPLNFAAQVMQHGEKHPSPAQG